MLIECLTEREGTTQITLGKTTYNFMPIPRFDENGKLVPVTTSYCDVNSEEHLNYFLSRANFRTYVPAQSRTVVKTEKNILEGYSIEVFGNGYVARKVKNGNMQWAGQDGVWKNVKAQLAPFQTEFEAYNWMKEDAEMVAMDEEQAPVEPPKQAIKGK